MNDASHRSESDQDRSNARVHGDRPPMPRWVKAFIAAVVLLVLLFLVSMLLGVRHGPGRHAATGLDIVATLPSAGPR